jgi:hypothetical protein
MPRIKGLRARRPRCPPSSDAVAADVAAATLAATPAATPAVAVEDIAAEHVADVVVANAVTDDPALSPASLPAPSPAPSPAKADLSNHPAIVTSEDGCKYTSDKRIVLSGYVLARKTKLRSGIFKGLYPLTLQE